MSRARVWALCLCVGSVAILPAQTHAPATPAQPLQRQAVFNGNAQTVNRAGEVAAPEGGGGTIDVDVLGIAPDGALVVAVSEVLHDDARRLQVHTCTVYANTNVMCPLASSPSEVEWVLLGYLGRQFVDAAPWDANGRWQRTTRTTEADVQEDFTLVDRCAGKNATVRETEQAHLHNGNFDDQTSSITIKYDCAMEVPDVIADEVDATRPAEASHASYLFTLKRDSFAKAAAPGSQPGG